VGEEWLNEVTLVVDLSCAFSELHSNIEHSVKRKLSEQVSASVLGEGKALDGELDRIANLSVWGIRALDSSVKARKATRSINMGPVGVQLYNRDLPEKVDMQWSEFVQKLPIEKRSSVPGSHSFTLYLAYHYGISTHRDLRETSKKYASYRELTRPAVGRRS